MLSRFDSKVDYVILLVMQRLYIDDLVAHVKETEVWHHLDLPSIAYYDMQVSLGYDAIKKKLIVNEVEAKIVQKIFALYIETKNIIKIMEFAQGLKLKSKICTRKNGTKIGGTNFS